MEITINFQDGPLDVEIQTTEEEDFHDVLGKLSEFLENYSFHSIPEAGERDETPEDDEDSYPASQNLEDIPIDQLTRVIKRGRVEDGEIGELPRIIANTRVFGDSDEEKLLHAATVILAIFDEFHGMNKIKTTQLKQALADSGLNADNWSNISRLENEEVYLTRRGKGPSATTKLRPPGKDKALELVNLLVDQIN